MKDLLTAIILGLTLCPALPAQQIARTLEGRNIVLYDDFTWDYADNLVPEMSEDCRDYVEEIDDGRTKTGKVRVTRNKVYIGEPTDDIGIGFFMVEDSENILLEVQVEGDETCFSDDDFALFVFQDGKEIKLQNITSHNCKGTSQYIISLEDKHILREFGAKLLKELKLYHDAGSIEKEVADLPSRSLIKTMECLLGR